MACRQERLDKFSVFAVGGYHSALIDPALNRLPCCQPWSFRMTLYAFVYSLHLLAALIWVGGMFFAWMILRPAAVSALDAPHRLRLWAAVFPRFFLWVWAAVLVLPVTGVGMLDLRFSGFDSAPRYVNIMMGLYLVMLALFLRIQVLQLPQLQRAVTAEDWPTGGAILGRIRRLVGINLLIGLLVVAIAGARPSF